jgi:hypothetical protein
MKSKLVYVLCFATCFIFSGCKKYPENTLWFKKPEKVFKGGYITLYTIDGIDKLPDVRSWYANFPYNFYKQTSDIFQLPFSYSGSDGGLSTDYGKGSLVFSTSTKNVTIDFRPVNSDYGAQNLFVANDNWTVLKLTKNGQLKLQGRFNEKTYVIQFN